MTIGMDKNGMCLPVPLANKARARLHDGVEWRGKRYRSLSIVAREITGAHWSGSRFFGLKRLSK